MLSWIPLIGPIIQGLSAPLMKFFDTKAALAKTEADRDVAEAQVSRDIIHDTQDDIGLRFMRDLAILPVVVWSCLMGWDTIIAGRMRDGTPYHPDLIQYQWHVPDYPVAVAYLPYVVMVFLFGNIGLNIWKRK